jgi:F0F1-type ATP synthase assembly protein I
MMISGGDLAVCLFAVGIILGFFVMLRRAMRRAERAETSEDQDSTS